LQFTEEAGALHLRAVRSREKVIQPDINPECPPGFIMAYGFRFSVG